MMILQYVGMGNKILTLLQFVKPEIERIMDDETTKAMSDIGKRFTVSLTSPINARTMPDLDKKVIPAGTYQMFEFTHNEATYIGCHAEKKICCLPIGQWIDRANVYFDKKTGRVTNITSKSGG